MSLSHLCLCGTSIWALRQIPKNYKWAYGTYSFLTAYGVLGCLTSSEGRLFDSILLRNATLVAEIIPIPFINAELYINKNDHEMSLIHTLTATIPLAIKFFANEENSDIMNVILGGNLASIIYYSISYENVWGIVLAINHFLFTRMISISDEPKLDLFTIGLSFFNIFSCRALLLSKKQNEKKDGKR